MGCNGDTGRAVGRKAWWSPEDPGGLCALPVKAAVGTVMAEGGKSLLVARGVPDTFSVTARGGTVFPGATYLPGFVFT